jgi:hypothetical protein
VKPKDEIQLTTLSFVQMTKAPRPRPTPTGQISKVDPTPAPEDEEFTTTFSVVSTDDRKVVSTEQPTVAAAQTTSKVRKIMKI